MYEKFLSCLWHISLAMDLIQYSSDLMTPTIIRRRIIDLIASLKRKRLWRLLDLPTRGWLELASSLEGIKFRSRQVLSVLMKILARLQPLLNLSNLLRFIGLSRAWRNSVLAEEWGNISAKRWRSNPVYQAYCGLIEIQASRIVPTLSFQAEWLDSYFPEAFLRILRRIA